ncbi:hypothetical protein M9458_052119, partial [Cirrhinus mrigala]
MPLGTLHSRAAFFTKKPRLTSTASRSGPSASGYEAAAMCVEGEQEEMSDVLPASSLRRSLWILWLDLTTRTRWAKQPVVFGASYFQPQFPHSRTIQLGYAIHLARRPPKYRGVLSTSVRGENAAVLRAEIAVLLGKDAIETVPSTKIKKGFYSPYFIVPKKGGGLRPISDLRILNRALLKLPFKMLTLKHILTYVRAQDWFVVIDLKDAYFHISILPRYRPFLRFALEGRAYQYKVLPFGLSLSPRTFTKGRDSQPPGSFETSGQLGKEQALPRAEYLFSQCGTGLGHYVCTTLPRARIVSTEVCGSTQTRVSGPPETISEVPGAHGILSRSHAAGSDAHETATALASYPSPAMGMAPRHVPCEHHTVVSQNTQPLGKHVLVHSDNTATVAYINHQGGVCSFRMSQLARHLLLWSQHRLRSLRATHISGDFNRVADSLSRQISLRDEWRLHPPVSPADLESVRPGTSRSLCLTGIHPLPVVVQTNRGPPRYRCSGTQLAEGPTQNLVLGPGAPSISSSLAHSSEEGPPLSGEGHNLAPAPRSLEPPPMVPGRDQEDFRDLSPSVVNTLFQARAPSTRRLYDLKWRIFVNWCSSQVKDPRRCGMESVLSFLQGGLDRHLSASTLKVNVAAISANHDLVEGRS